MLLSSCCDSSNGGSSLDTLRQVGFVYLCVCSVSSFASLLLVGSGGGSGGDREDGFVAAIS